jgi:chloride channel protein, CIC family
MVYASEDAFKRLPLHWMWWPAIGGLVIGLGGLIFPQALGVGYGAIGALLAGNVTTGVIAGVLLVKSVIWAVSLGSGTSGGVLAPLLMMGAALGSLASLVLPHEGAGFWALIAMGAILGGAMRVPITGIAFALELTHDVNALLPLLIAGVASYGVTVLLLRRSILTEKVARRGYHLSREYAVDPLEIVFVREALRRNIVALPERFAAESLVSRIRPEALPRGQHLFPIVGDDRKLVGVITRQDLQRVSAASSAIAALAEHTREPVVAYLDEPLRVVEYRMAATGFTRMPVVERGAAATLVGMISLTDLLTARARNLEAERRRERILPIRVRIPWRVGQPAPPLA